MRLVYQVGYTPEGPSARCPLPDSTPPFTSWCCPSKALSSTAPAQCSVPGSQASACTVHVAASCASDKLRVPVDGPCGQAFSFVPVIVWQCPSGLDGDALLQGSTFMSHQKSPSRLPGLKVQSSSRAVCPGRREPLCPLALPQSARAARTNATGGMA